MPNRSRNRGNANRSSSSDQPLMSGWMESAKDRPLTTAAAVGGAVAAGVFLWSRRNQISDQLGQLTDQISDWSDQMRGQQATRAGGRSSTPLGTETGEPLAGAGTTAKSSTRATGGRSGKAQRGQTTSPSREEAPIPGL